MGKVTQGVAMINQDSIDLIKKYEGLRLKAYVCPAGKLTIGYGHTKSVKASQRITEAEADALLLEDLRGFEAAVKASIKVPVSENQIGALVSFAFNVGLGAFRRSTLLKRLNAGDYKAVPTELLKWNKAGGVVLPGLTARRAAEGFLWGKKCLPKKQLPVLSATSLPSEAASLSQTAQLSSLSLKWPSGLWSRFLAWFGR
jgi:GH24 family phage-related lysozyme (muramidase)